MPRGPKGEKHPRDTDQLAKLMVHILTGDVEDHEPRRRNRARRPAAVTESSLPVLRFESADR